MWTEGSKIGGTTRDGWRYEHHFATGVSYAHKILPDGKPDPAFPDELVSEGDGHEHAIFDLIAEQIIEDEDREPVELRRAS